MTESPVETLTEIFELLNVPKRTTARTVVYERKDIDAFLDKLEVVIESLGGNVYGE